MEITMTVYADILFLTNFFMDYIIIRLSAACMRLKPGKMRILAAAALGALYAVGMLIPKLSVLYTVISRLLLSCVLTALIFAPCGISCFAEAAVTLFSVSCAVGGAAYFFMLFTGGGVIKNGIVCIKSYKLFFSALLAYFAIRRAVRLTAERGLRRKCRAVLCFRGKKITLDGFCDTGNFLADPISKRAVLPVSNAALEKILGRGCRAEVLTEWLDPTDIRLIPCRTVSGEGVLYGFEAEGITVNGRTAHNIIIAASKNPISHEIILNPSLF